MVLAHNVTLSDVLETLTKPERYIRMALKNMQESEREFGELVLRIGRMGTGQVPHYRLDRREPNILLDYVAQFPVRAFNGRNHKPLVVEGEESDILRNEHWSQAGMNKQEIAELLGHVRGKGRRA